MVTIVRVDVLVVEMCIVYYICGLSRKKFSLAQLPLSIGSAALTAPNFGQLALFSTPFQATQVHKLEHFSVSFDAGKRWGAPHRWTTKRWGTTDSDMSYS
jgi:hypothetical protein